VADNLKAIETQYRGCTFRSRLEARWAVFFDEMGWVWQYEHQGYECSWRLSDCTSDATFNYLPDFFLPELNTFVEVKAQIDDEQLNRFLNAAAHLSNKGENNPQVLVLCDFRSTPHPDWTFIPQVLRFHKGDLGMKPHPAFMAERFRDPESWPGKWIAWDCPRPDLGLEGPYKEYGYSLDRIRFDLLEKLEFSFMASQEYLRALKAAMSSRFEHGQSGSPKAWSR
jgi:hypothetical protein